MANRKRWGMAAFVAVGAWLNVSGAARGQGSALGADAGSIAAALQRLPVWGSALYVAAHPDDENTRLIAWLAGERGVRTAYLSMTRGGGGQNLLGAEQGAALDWIRTEELLAARNIDGGEQFFTRARDYGYSKSPEEALGTWGHEEALADVVWAIRRFQPDVIISRFPTHDPGNHGHHVASAQLALRAFDAAADPEQFPDQLSFVGPWQARRLLRNVSTWRLPPDADLSQWPSVDVGAYSPLRGESFGEVAARSRSMHKSQGFGSAPQRGQQFEYFEWLAGAPIAANSTDPIFEGIGLRATGSPEMDAFNNAAREAIEAFKPDAPEQAIGALTRALLALRQVPASSLRDAKMAEVQRLVAACAGLWVQARSVAWACPGESLAVDVEVVQRRPFKNGVQWTACSVELGQNGELLARLKGAGALDVNAPARQSAPIELPREVGPSLPHWLQGPATAGLYTPSHPSLRAEPREPAPLLARFSISVNDVPIELITEVEHARVDPVHGERLRRFVVAPAITASPLRRFAVATPGRPAKAEFSVRAWAQAPVSGKIVANVPSGWAAEPTHIPISLAAAGQEMQVAFTLQRTAQFQQSGGPEMALMLDFVPEGSTKAVGVHQVSEVDYPHIPSGWLFELSRLPLVSVDAKVQARRVAVVPGAGDDTADALVQLGVAVDVLEPAALEAADLTQYDAVIFGVRAFNVHERLRRSVARLSEWVRGGGVWVVQYTTNNHIGKQDFSISPVPLVVGRGRTTQESAEVVHSDQNHPVLRWPNLIGPEDWSGWVQERGLYYAQSWEAPLVGVLSMADPGEAPLLGALVTGRVGQGTYVYTGLALFRQWPGGVPGAFKLLANLVSSPKGKRDTAPSPRKRTR